MSEEQIHSTNIWIDHLIKRSKRDKKSLKQLQTKTRKKKQLKHLCNG